MTGIPPIQAENDAVKLNGGHVTQFNKRTTQENNSIQKSSSKEIH